MKKYFTNKEDIINFETMGGWPVLKQNLRSIIEALGGTLNQETGCWEIKESEMLDIYPLLLEDDGMGYGVNEQYITDVNLDTKNGFCNMFRETKLDNIDIWMENGLYPGCVIRYKGGKEVVLHKISIDDNNTTWFVGCIIDYDVDERSGTLFKQEPIQIKYDDIKKYIKPINTNI